jgi:tryptophan synthase alpha chain
MSDSTVTNRLRVRKDESNGSLIGYLPVGFPDLTTSIDAAVAMVEGGVDIVELGLPYSDPVMDGPVIQAATVHALQEGFRVVDAFTAIREITRQVDAPVLVMSYWNLVLQYGIDRFADELKDAGGAGLITPDLIPDEAADWLVASDRAELDRVFLAAPTSSDARLRSVTELSRGFVYTVSTMGVTGARGGVDRAARTLVERLREVGCTQSCVGLGISTGAQVREVLDYADGAIVGSALVRALASDGVAGVRTVAADLASGTGR